MNPNELLLNKAFCIEIESENAKCHPDLGDLPEVLTEEV
jgi:hypothetical protein